MVCLRVLPALTFATFVGCAEQPDDQPRERAAAASDALVSPSFDILTTPAGSYDVAWECGVGLLVWVETEPTYARIKGLRFDQAGNHLDAAPFLLVEQALPSPPVVDRWISSVRLERSALGFVLAYVAHESFVNGFSGNSSSARTMFIATDGAVQAGQTLATISDTAATPFVPATVTRLLILSTAFDGEHAFILVNTGRRDDPPPSFGTETAAVYREDGIPIDQVAQSGLGLFFSSPVRAFACGFGRCLFNTHAGSDRDRLFADTALIQEESYSGLSSSPIPTGFSPIPLESCGFLMPTALVEGLEVTGGPHMLPQGLESKFVHDGDGPRHYFNDAGLSSHTFATDGAPIDVTLEDPNLTLAPDGRIKAMGDGKSIWVYRVGDTFVARYLGPNALVPVEGQCDPEGDLGLVSGVTPDCTLALGAPCAHDGMCLSGSCADGVCCNQACSDGCGACSAALGASADGICSPLPATETCRPSTGDCDPAELCNGANTLCPPEADPSGMPCQDGTCVGSTCVPDPGGGGGGSGGNRATGGSGGENTGAGGSGGQNLGAGGGNGGQNSGAGGVAGTGGSNPPTAGAPSSNGGSSTDGGAPNNANDPGSTNGCTCSAAQPMSDHTAAWLLLALAMLHRLTPASSASAGPVYAGARCRTHPSSPA